MLTQFVEALQDARACASASRARRASRPPCGWASPTRRRDRRDVAGMVEPFADRRRSRSRWPRPARLEDEGFVEIARRAARCDVPVRVIYGEQDRILRTIADTWSGSSATSRRRVTALDRPRTLPAGGRPGADRRVARRVLRAALAPPFGQVTRPSRLFRALFTVTSGRLCHPDVPDAPPRVHRAWELEGTAAVSLGRRLLGPAVRVGRVPRRCKSRRRVRRAPPARHERGVCCPRASLAHRREGAGAGSAGPTTAGTSPPMGWPPSGERRLHPVSNSENLVGGASAMRIGPTARSRRLSHPLGHDLRTAPAAARPWGTWLSCEEVSDGRVWECDPTGARRASCARRWASSTRGRGGGPAQGGAST